MKIDIFRIFASGLGIVLGYEAIWAGLLANGVVAMSVAGKVTLPEARAQPYSS